MSNEETRNVRGLGPFRLLRRCDEVEPRLGRLYESWNVVTGRPALTLFPHDSVEWRPVGRWRGWIYFEPGQDSVSLEMECEPDSEQAMDWVNVFTLMTVAGQRVEDSPQVKAHLAGRPMRSHLRRWTAIARWMLCSRAGWATAGIAVLALGLGVWHWRAGGSPDPMRHAAEFMPVESLTWIDKTEAPLVIAYPMPDAAFPEQQKPPCDEGDVEIHGGCWGVMEQRAPCHKGYAEYQGRCYAPVRKKKPVPRSLHR